MIFVGSKARYWDKIAPIVLEHRHETDTYVEPFAGGMNCITNVPNTLNRWAFDIDVFVINLWQNLQMGMLPPEELCDKDTYNRAKAINRNIEGGLENVFSYSNEEIFEIACWKFLGSYGRKPFAGWVGGTKVERDYYGEARTNLINHVNSAIDLKSINFICDDYRNLGLEKACIKPFIIYCDPPYLNATKVYGHRPFDSRSFWDWCRKVREAGHFLYISECQAPADFTCVWEKERSVGLQNGLSKSTLIEKLWV